VIGARVLVVDDDSFVQERQRVMLTHAGVEVVEASTSGCGRPKGELIPLKACFGARLNTQSEPSEKKEKRQ
jgi:hypothetical protein